MIVRNATLKDIDKCVKISHIPEFTYLHKISDKKARDYLKEFYKKGILIVAEENNEIVGFINCEFMLGNFVWVDGITVKEEYRGKGIGKKLFQKFKNVLNKKKIKHIYLIAPKSNKSTVHFYKSIGMEEGKEFIEFSKELMKP